MEEKIYNLLSYISAKCKGKFTIFAKSELNKKYGDGTVTEDEFTSLLESLEAGGYIDVKYADKDVLLVRPLGKSLVAEPDKKSELAENVNVRKNNSADFFRFFIAFLGGFSGALAGMAVFAAIC